MLEQCEHDSKTQEQNYRLVVQRFDMIAEFLAAGIITLKSESNG